MSTKLYSGLIAHTTNLFDLARTIRAHMSVVVEEAKQEQFGDDLTRVWDFALQGLPEGSPLTMDTSVATAAILYRMDQDRRDSSPEGTHNGALDWKVTALPYGGDATLLLVHAVNPDYRLALLEAPGFEDFAYWDNSDRPGDVSADEWRDRRSAWELALAPDWVPANHGVSIGTSTWDRGIFDEHHDDSWILDALRYQPSLRSRIVSPLTARAAEHVAADDLPSVLPEIVMEVAYALQEIDDNILGSLAPHLHPLTVEDARGPLPSPAPMLDDDAAQEFLAATLKGAA